MAFQLTTTLSVLKFLEKAATRAVAEQDQMTGIWIHFIVVLFFIAMAIGCLGGEETNDN
jgi:hypothetical protein